jgi:hypothetical protein
VAAASWIGGGLTGASIDNSGNIIRTPSDAVTKKKIRTRKSALKKLNKLRVVNFNYKRRYGITQTRQCGLIAQEVQKILPKLVHQTGIDDTLGVNYIGLIPLLLRAVQELSEKIKN